MLRQLVVAQLLLLLPTAGAQAQTDIVNPRYVEYTASVDHAATLPGGAPVLTSYEVQWFAAGASSPLQTADIGKPTPDATQHISVDLLAQFIGIPIGTGYTVKVVAKGPSGDGVSEASNPFARVAAVAAPTNVSVR